ncbi:GNAT family N-acetyltransferase [Mycoplasmatota bacterium]|nr:GNAT family N-acetyltransferase [Mycoplasmatota bacterium]
MITITQTNSLQEEDKKTIIDGLVKYNETFTGHYEVSYIKLILKEKEVIVGGLYGVFIWDCLFVDDYWVDDAYRNQGLGKYLINQAEKITLEHQIDYITFDAFDEKLKDYFIDRGYQVYGYLNNRPMGHQYYLLDKRLSDDSIETIDCPKNIILNKNPNKGETAQFQEKLKQTKEALIGQHSVEKVYVTARNENEEIIGGLIGNIEYDCLYIGTLWVHDDYRKNNLGKKLMTKAEKHALEKGIKQIYLGTTDFQARPFYEKLGYKVFAVSEDLPKGFNDYCMNKVL